MEVVALYMETLIYMYMNFGFAGTQLTVLKRGVCTMYL